VRSRQWAGVGRGEVVSKDIAGGEDVGDWATVEPTNNHARREPFSENKAYLDFFFFFNKKTQEKGNHNRMRKRTIMGSRFSHSCGQDFFF
jgi:hypothetical protein